MITERQFTILLFGMIVSGLISMFLLFYYTFPNEMNVKNSMSYIDYFIYCSHPKFDYFNGLWLMPVGVFFFCIISILELPQNTNLWIEKIKKERWKIR